MSDKNKVKLRGGPGRIDGFEVEVRYGISAIEVPALREAWREKDFPVKVTYCDRPGEHLGSAMANHRYELGDDGEYHYARSTAICNTCLDARREHRHMMGTAHAMGGPGPG